ncbi:sigma-70 family RNA polymerase sigma factor [Jatrophihabitans lederbergiae]|uniref:Uncharacterized protein n=1 Tax=Jatrophihabitans lederbergiae TaxID=3075547 RepID=A0ABU2JE66_9ACTN|nr:hypothetical protein [Jatrophihabitans sp. DSM 44399]MDT0262974.1 hypothetical protein [Jatrophihabitans sp. DSM 44399]
MDWSAVVERYGPSWERELRHRLRDGDETALLELFDHTAPAVYSHALAVTGSARRAARLTRRTYLETWLHPEVLADVRVPVRTRTVMLAHRLASCDVPRLGRRTHRRALAATSAQRSGG